jgi:hypothetical protein
MSTSTTTSFRRTAAIAAATSFAAIATTFAAQPAQAAEPDPERPCFIAQPRWNEALDGPAPTCPRPTWQPATEEERPANAWTEPRTGFDDFMP